MGSLDQSQMDRRFSDVVMRTTNGLDPDLI
jgi:hypothetical protein